jgi:hypothetical protein
VPHPRPHRCVLLFSLRPLPAMLESLNAQPSADVSWLTAHCILPMFRFCRHTCTAPADVSHRYPPRLLPMCMFKRLSAPLSADVSGLTAHYILPMCPFHTPPPPPTDVSCCVPSVRCRRCSRSPALRRCVLFNRPLYFADVPFL